jgi:16S rRNA (cytidine1402-2'-O)-methyltransferase
VGKIILLNTPIGNLGDLTPRVLEALKTGENFAVEDTRVFKELLNHLGIGLAGKQIVSLHDQSSEKEVERLLERARASTLYVASEAGSPMVSDPAFPLIRAAYEAGIEVDSYSGVSSPIMALELSGLPPIPFHFHGFLPREKGKISEIFNGLDYGTHIFFEAPTRIEATLNHVTETNNLEFALVRELSKKFQQVARFPSKDWKHIKKEINFKGEFILLCHQSSTIKSLGSSDIKATAEEILEEGASPKKVAKLLGLILDRPTKEIYALLSRQKKDE